MTSIYDAQVTLPAGSQGVAKVVHFEISEAESRFSALRAFQHPGEFVRPGKYTQLLVHGQIMMSDTTMERQTNAAFVRHAHDRVLVAGLGIGLILEAALQKPEVETVTVIEKYQDVVDLVGPTYLEKYGDKLTIITADIFEWRPIPKEMTYSVIYFDIWPTICEDALKDMARLHRRFGRHLDKTDPDCWMDSWQRSYLQARRRANQRRGW